MTIPLSHLVVPAGAARLALHPADARLIETVFAQTRVDQSPSRPSIGSWFGDALETIMGKVARAVWGNSSLAAGIAGAAKLIAVALLLLAVALLVFSIARRVRALRGRRGSPVPELQWTEVPEGRPPLSRIAWRRQVEARLARGDIAGSLEALWWWLAISLLPDSSIDASWTTRELLEKTRRSELSRLGSTLDALMYGPRSATPADVRGCLSGLEERLE